MYLYVSLLYLWNISSMPSTISIAYVQECHVLRRLRYFGSSILYYARGWAWEVTYPLPPVLPRHQEYFRLGMMFSSCFSLYVSAAWSNVFGRDLCKAFTWYSITGCILWRERPYQPTIPKDRFPGLDMEIEWVAQRKMPGVAQRQRGHYFYYYHHSYQ